MSRVNVIRCQVAALAVALAVAIVARAVLAGAVCLGLFWAAGRLAAWGG